MENSQLLEHIGETKTEKLINNIGKEFQENLVKRFPDYYNSQVLKSLSIVSITENKEIKSIGMSCMNDLLNDNFGNFLKGILGIQTFNMNDLANVSKQYIIPSPTVAYNMLGIGSLGTNIRVGKGLTPATRQDFNIQDPFTTSPESVAFQLAGDGAWNSGLGQVSMSGAITAGDSGAISEAILIQQFRNFNIGAGTSIFSRDNISPVANFIIGQTINVNYILLLS